MLYSRSCTTFNLASFLDTQFIIHISSSIGLVHKCGLWNVDRSASGFRSAEGSRDREVVQRTDCAFEIYFFKTHCRIKVVIRKDVTANAVVPCMFCTNVL